MSLGEVLDRYICKNAGVMSVKCVRFDSDVCVCVWKVTLKSSTP